VVTDATVPVNRSKEEKQRLRKEVQEAILSVSESLFRLLNEQEFVCCVLSNGASIKITIHDYRWGARL